MTAIRHTQTSSAAPRFSVELFKAFWSAPNFDDTGGVLADDIRGYWPGRTEPLTGLERYEAPLQRLVQRVPDFRLEVAAHASQDDITFIHWIARGTWQGEPLGFEGVDRIRVRDGLVVENRIFCSHPLIEEVLRDLGI